MKLQPFLKWAGGKRWLVDREEFVAPAFSGSYVEPFLGGGAVFFHLQPKRALLSDANAALIEAYCVIRDSLDPLLTLLEIHHKHHSKDYYYEIRRGSFITPVERAAQFIYLNRACWNGLYRVNRRGEFNVPIGTKDWILSSDDQFDAISHALRRVTIKHSDFADTISAASEGDFVFVDPPYTTAHNLNGFVKYNSTIFSWHDQERLKSSISGAVSRGAIVMMTNADHESIHALYAGIGRSRVVQRQSVISGSSISRKPTTEALFVFKT